MKHTALLSRARWFARLAFHGTPADRAIAATRSQLALRTGMRRLFGFAAIALALGTLGTAHAETLDSRGRVHQTTADRIVAERQLACRYTGKVRTVTLPNGSTAVILSKVCR